MRPPPAEPVANGGGLVSTFPWAMTKDRHDATAFRASFADRACRYGRGGVNLPASPTNGAPASSLMGESKYGENFKHYDYVNPDAPKGGTLNSVVSGTFDSFNPVHRARLAGRRLAAFSGGLIYDTLMEQATDEAQRQPPLIADAYKYPEDFSSATYRIDPRAKWHDGTADHRRRRGLVVQRAEGQQPEVHRYFANVTEAVAISDREVEFHFDQKGNRELPQILGDLVVLPKHWWEGTDANGKKRDITKPTLEPPLGSGAYKIDSFKPGSEIVWSRVKDYWAADLPVNVGRNNFDRRRYVYIQDENAAWQAFTKGGFEDIQLENSSKRWSTEYDFPAVKAGDVIKREFKTRPASRCRASRSIIAARNSRIAASARR